MQIEELLRSLAEDAQGVASLVSGRADPLQPFTFEFLRSLDPTNPVQSTAAGLTWGARARARPVLNAVHSPMPAVHASASVRYYLHAMNDPVMRMKEVPDIMESILLDPCFFAVVEEVPTQSFRETVRQTATVWWEHHGKGILHEHNNRASGGGAPPGGTTTTTTTSALNPPTGGNEEEVNNSSQSTGDGAVTPSRDVHQHVTDAELAAMDEQLRVFLTLFVALGSPYRTTRPIYAPFTCCTARVMLCQDPAIIYLSLLLNMSQSNLPEKVTQGAPVFRTIAECLGGAVGLPEIIEWCWKRYTYLKNKLTRAARGDSEDSDPQPPAPWDVTQAISGEKFSIHSIPGLKTTASVARGDNSNTNTNNSSSPASGLDYNMETVAQACVDSMERSALDGMSCLWWARNRLLCFALLSPVVRGQVMATKSANFYSSVWRCEELFSEILRDHAPARPTAIPAESEADWKELDDLYACLVGTIADVSHFWLTVHQAANGELLQSLSAPQLNTTWNAVNTYVPSNPRFRREAFRNYMEYWPYSLLIDTHLTQVVVMNPAREGHVAIAQMVSLLQREPDYYPALIMSVLTTREVKDLCSTALNAGLVDAMVKCLRHYLPSLPDLPVAEHVPLVVQQVVPTTTTTAEGNEASNSWSDVEEDDQAEEEGGSEHAHEEGEEAGDDDTGMTNENAAANTNNATAGTVEATSYTFSYTPPTLEEGAAEVVRLHNATPALTLKSYSIIMTFLDRLRECVMQSSHVSLNPVSLLLSPFDDEASGTADTAADSSEQPPSSQPQTTDGDEKEAHHASSTHSPTQQTAAGGKMDLCVVLHMLLRQTRYGSLAAYSAALLAVCAHQNVRDMIPAYVERGIVQTILDITHWPQTSIRPVGEYKKQPSLSHIIPRSSNGDDGCEDEEAHTQHHADSASQARMLSEYVFEDIDYNSRACPMAAAILIQALTVHSSMHAVFTEHTGWIKGVVSSLKVTYQTMGDLHMIEWYGERIAPWVRLHYPAVRNEQGRLASDSCLATERIDMAQSFSFYGSTRYFSEMCASSMRDLIQTVKAVPSLVVPFSNELEQLWAHIDATCEKHHRMLATNTKCPSKLHVSTRSMLEVSMMLMNAMIPISLSEMNSQRNLRLAMSPPNANSPMFELMQRLVEFVIPKISNAWSWFFHVALHVGEEESSDPNAGEGERDLSKLTANENVPSFWTVTSLMNRRTFGSFFNSLPSESLRYLTQPLLDYLGSVADMLRKSETRQMPLTNALVLEYVLVALFMAISRTGTNLRSSPKLEEFRGEVSTKIAEIYVLLRCPGATDNNTNNSTNTAAASTNNNTTALPFSFATISSFPHDTPFTPTQRVTPDMEDDVGVLGDNDHPDRSGNAAQSPTTRSTQSTATTSSPASLPLASGPNARSFYVRLSNIVLARRSNGTSNVNRAESLSGLALNDSRWLREGAGDINNGFPISPLPLLQAAQVQLRGVVDNLVRLEFMLEPEELLQKLPLETMREAARRIAVLDLSGCMYSTRTGYMANRNQSDITDAYHSIAVDIKYIAVHLLGRKDGARCDGGDSTHGADEASSSPEKDKERNLSKLRTPWRDAIMDITSHLLCFPVSIHSRSTANRTRWISNVAPLMCFIFDTMPTIPDMPLMPDLYLTALNQLSRAGKDLFTIIQADGTVKSPALEYKRPTAAGAAASPSDSAPESEVINDNTAPPEATSITCAELASKYQEQLRLNLLRWICDSFCGKLFDLSALKDDSQRHSLRRSCSQLMWSCWVGVPEERRAWLFPRLLQPVMEEPRVYAPLLEHLGVMLTQKQNVILTETLARTVIPKAVLNCLSQALDEIKRDPSIATPSERATQMKKIQVQLYNFMTCFRNLRATKDQSPAAARSGRDRTCPFFDTHNSFCWFGHNCSNSHPVIPLAKPYGMSSVAASEQRLMNLDNAQQTVVNLLLELMERYGYNSPRLEENNTSTATTTNNNNTNNVASDNVMTPSITPAEYDAYAYDWMTQPSAPRSDDPFSTEQVDVDTMVGTLNPRMMAQLREPVLPQALRMTTHHMLRRQGATQPPRWFVIPSVTSQSMPLAALLLDNYFTHLPEDVAADLFNLLLTDTIGTVEDEEKTKEHSKGGENSVGHADGGDASSSSSSSATFNAAECSLPRVATQLITQIATTFRQSCLTRFNKFCGQHRGAHSLLCRYLFQNEIVDRCNTEVIFTLRLIMEDLAKEESIMQRRMMATLKELVHANRALRLTEASYNGLVASGSPTEIDTAHAAAVLASATSPSRARRPRKAADDASSSSPPSFVVASGAQPTFDANGKVNYNWYVVDAVVYFSCLDYAVIKANPHSFTSLLQHQVRLCWVQEEGRQLTESRLCVWLRPATSRPEAAMSDSCLKRHHTTGKSDQRHGATKEGASASPAPAAVKCPASAAAHSPRRHPREVLEIVLGEVMACMQCGQLSSTNATRVLDRIVESTSIVAALSSPYVTVPVPPSLQSIIASGSGGAATPKSHPRERGKTPAATTTSLPSVLQRSTSATFSGTSQNLLPLYVPPYIAIALFFGPSEETSFPSVFFSTVSHRQTARFSSDLCALLRRALSLLRTLELSSSEKNTVAGVRQLVCVVLHVVRKSIVLAPSVQSGFKLCEELRRRGMLSCLYDAVRLRCCWDTERDMTTLLFLTRRLILASDAQMVERMATLLGKDARTTAPEPLDATAPAASNYTLPVSLAAPAAASAVRGDTTPAESEDHLAVHMEDAFRQPAGAHNFLAPEDRLITPTGSDVFDAGNAVQVDENVFMSIFEADNEEDDEYDDDDDDDEEDEEEDEGEDWDINEEGEEDDEQDGDGEDIGEDEDNEDYDVWYVDEHQQGDDDDDAGNDGHEVDNANTAQNPIVVVEGNEDDDDEYETADEDEDEEWHQDAEDEEYYNEAYDEEMEEEEEEIAEHHPLHEDGAALGGVFVLEDIFAGGVPGDMMPTTVLGTRLPPHDMSARQLNRLGTYAAGRGGVPSQQPIVNGFVSFISHLAMETGLVSEENVIHAETRPRILLAYEDEPPTEVVADVAPSPSPSPSPSSDHAAITEPEPEPEAVPATQQQQQQQDDQPSSLPVIQVSRGDDENEEEGEGDDSEGREDGADPQHTPRTLEEVNERIRQLFAAGANTATLAAPAPERLPSPPPPAPAPEPPAAPAEPMPWEGVVDPIFLAQIPLEMRSEIVFNSMNLLRTATPYERLGSQTCISPFFLDQVAEDIQRHILETEQRWLRVTGAGAAENNADGAPADPATQRGNELYEILLFVDDDVRRDVLLTCDLDDLRGHPTLVAEATQLRNALREDQERLQRREAAARPVERRMRDDLIPNIIDRLNTATGEGGDGTTGGMRESPSSNTFDLFAFQNPQQLLDSYLDPRGIRNRSRHYLTDVSDRSRRAAFLHPPSSVPPIASHTLDALDAGRGSENLRHEAVRLLAEKPPTPENPHHYHALRLPAVPEDVTTACIGFLSRGYTDADGAETRAHLNRLIVPGATLQAGTVVGQLSAWVRLLCIDTASAAQIMHYFLDAAVAAVKHSDGDAVPASPTMPQPSDGMTHTTKVILSTLHVIRELIKTNSAAAQCMMLLPDDCTSTETLKAVNDDKMSAKEAGFLKRGVFASLTALISQHLHLPRVRDMYLELMLEVGKSQKSFTKEDVAQDGDDPCSDAPLSSYLIEHPRHVHKLKWVNIKEYMSYRNGGFICNVCSINPKEDYCFHCDLCHFDLCPRCSLVRLTVQEDLVRLRRSMYHILSTSNAVQEALAVLRSPHCTRTLAATLVRFIKVGVKESAARDGMRAGSRTPILTVEAALVTTAKSLASEIRETRKRFKEGVQRAVEEYLHADAGGDRRPKHQDPTRLTEPSSVFSIAVPEGFKFSSDTAIMLLHRMNLPNCARDMVQSLFIPYASTNRSEPREMQVLWNAAQAYLQDITFVLQRLQEPVLIPLPSSAYSLLSTFCQYHLNEARCSAMSASASNLSLTGCSLHGETERFLAVSSVDPSVVSNKAMEAVQKTADYTERSAQRKTTDRQDTTRRRLPRFVRKFLEANRTTLNALLYWEPKLLDEAFHFLKAEPSLIDFTFKLNDFRSHIDIRRGQRITLHIDRQRCLEDSFQELKKVTTFNGPLQVRFRGEEGADAGGLTREWFQLLTEAVVNESYALFIHSREGMTYQPNPLSDVNVSHLEYFRFAGTVIGLAVANNVPMDIHFTRAVYRHMVGVQPVFQDLESVDPELYANVKWLLKNDVSELGLTFAVNYERFGEVQEEELCRGGLEMPVTNENKLQYVRLLCEFHMTKRIEPQLVAFLTGFYMVIPRDLVRAFTEHELELVISGMPEIDVEDLRSNTVYEGYTVSSPQIRWFWEVVGGMTKEDLANLLQFATGASKVPHGGFENLESSGGQRQRFTISRWNASTTDLLPQAHTCFNKIDLPEYPTAESLREKLMLAITYGSMGFTMV